MNPKMAMAIAISNTYRSDTNPMCSSEALVNLLETDSVVHELFGALSDIEYVNSEGTMIITSRKYDIRLRMLGARTHSVLTDVYRDKLRDIIAKEYFTIAHKPTIDSYPAYDAVKVLDKHYVLLMLYAVINYFDRHDQRVFLPYKNRKDPTEIEAILEHKPYF